jgi:hypothetical protein
METPQDRASRPSTSRAAGGSHPARRTTIPVRR